jgi:hypothetical protein
MSPQENPLKPHGKQKAERKKNVTLEEGTNWLMEA